MMNPVSPVCLLHHRFAGQGSPPASLCAGALAFSVPRLSTFLMTEELVSQGFANPGGGPRCMHAQCMATFKCVSIQSCPELLICSARCPERTSNVAAAFLLRPAVQPPPFSCSCSTIRPRPPLTLKPRWLPRRRRCTSVTMSRRPHTRCVSGGWKGQLSSGCVLLETLKGFPHLAPHLAPD